jgi:hypothetical protein
VNIKGRIAGIIKYKTHLSEPLQERDLDSFDINDSPTSCVVKDGQYIVAISKWVSPKRTRSYPYERVYNTLGYSKKITVIPIVKDEGKNGDRDFIQWDTISLASLLDVFVILAYYSGADAKAGKITDQKFDNSYVISKIKAIEKCHSSALHWNLNEIKDNLSNLIDLVKISYAEIEAKTRVNLHAVKGLDKFKAEIENDISKFMEFSRIKAAKAQTREFATIQPKESLATVSKAKITIGNYLGGLYYFTVDEAQISANKLFLIESKHSKNAILPSKGDIKDGLLKMILYSNLSDVTADERSICAVAVLNLTSILIKGRVSSEEDDLRVFIKHNDLSDKTIGFIKTLFAEAKENGFIVNIGNAK